MADGSASEGNAVRNISFALTTQQFLDGSKTVTRRLGWRLLKPGMLLQGCEKCMGLKPGEKINRLGVIQVVDARRECLNELVVNPNYGRIEAVKEGFPHMDGPEFVDMFCREMRVLPDVVVTRIAFKHVCVWKHDE